MNTKYEFVSGDTGGYIEAEACLSVSGNAQVYGDARVCESRQTPGTGSVAILNGATDAIRALKEKA